MFLKFLAVILMLVKLISVSELGPGFHSYLVTLSLLPTARLCVAQDMNAAVLLAGNLRWCLLSVA